MELNINPKDYLSDRSLKILEEKAKKECKPLQIVLLEFCEFLLYQKDLHEVVQQYADGNEAPDIRHLLQKDKVEFVKYRKNARAAKS